jgi:GDPmannose 4,6-dehydratase
MKRALITGIFGQDGSYLAELLSGKDYELHGIVRSKPSSHSLKLKAHLLTRQVTPLLHECDLTSYVAVRDLLKAIRPGECYHLAAVHYSAQNVSAATVEYDRYLLEQNIQSVLNILHAIREVSPDTRFVLAGSCLIYEDSGISPQSEATPARSKSVYGTSKIVGLQLTELFRNQYQLHASTAILYNHESPRRQEYFVSQKIAKGLVGIKRGETKQLQLGNLDDIKDWGFARDYAQGMWLMAQADRADDYILATGTGHTVADFVREAAHLLELSNWSEAVTVQPGLTRPATKTRLVGDPDRAQRLLGWTHSLDFNGLVDLMVQHELRGTLD